MPVFSLFAFLVLGLRVYYLIQTGYRRHQLWTLQDLMYTVSQTPAGSSTQNSYMRLSVQRRLTVLLLRVLKRASGKISFCGDTNLEMRTKIASTIACVFWSVILHQEFNACSSFVFIKWFIHLCTTLQLLCLASLLYHMNHCICIQ